MPLLSILTQGLNGLKYIKFSAAMTLGILIVAVIARLIFGKKSTLNRSVSCALAILFIYGVHVLLYCAGVRGFGILASLPYVSLIDGQLVFFRFSGAGLTLICQQILRLLILSLVMVIFDNILPRGKKFFPWLGLRLATVGLGMIAYHLIHLLLNPLGFLGFAPVILVILLLVTLLLGTLKLIIGGALAFISPLLAILYAFFFKNIIGKQLRKAVLTSAILTGLVVLLNYLGVGTIALGSGLLLCYLPILLIALALWFLVSRLF